MTRQRWHVVLCASCLLSLSCISGLCSHEIQGQTNSVPFLTEGTYLVQNQTSRTETRGIAILSLLPPKLFFERLPTVHVSRLGLEQCVRPAFSRWLLSVQLCACTKRQYRKSMNHSQTLTLQCFSSEGGVITVKRRTLACDWEFFQSPRALIVVEGSFQNKNKASVHFKIRDWANGFFLAPMRFLTTPKT